MSPNLGPARTLIQLGIPVFVAKPAYRNGERDWKAGAGGYILPKGWQNTTPDENILNTWQPGYALCAVMGHGLDAIDVDSHKEGGDTSLQHLKDHNHLPDVHAKAKTPSGGTHLFVASLGIASRDALLPGLDLKAGHEGSGHGFVFLHPTEKLSKATGEIGTYTWEQTPSQQLPEPDPITTNLRNLVAEVRGAKTPPSTETPTEPTEQDPAHVENYINRMRDLIAQELAEAAEWEDGDTDSRGRGWEKLVADAAWRLASAAITPGSGLTMGEAENIFRTIVPPVMAETDSYTATDKWYEQAPRAEAIHIQPPNMFGLPLPKVPDMASLKGETPSAPPEVPGMPPVFNPGVLRDISLAASVLEASKPLYRYAVDETSWYCRNDIMGYWEPANGSALDWARHLVYQAGKRAPEGDKDAPEGSDAQQQAHRWGRLNGNQGRTVLARLLMDQAPEESFRVDQMDSDPFLLWAGGWCWDLRASSERPALANVDLLQPHGHSAAVMPRDIPTPKWDAFIRAVFPDEVDRDYLYGVLGAATTGTSNRILGVLYGSTGMGKTTILEMVSMVLGTYASQLDPDLLVASRSNDFKVYGLKGIRLGWVDEGPSETRQGQERLKALTGGATQRGSRKGKDAISFQSTHTLFFTDNREPEVADPALLDRVRGFNMDQGDRSQISEAAGRILGDRQAWLATEGPGVLWRLIVAAARYLKNPSTADMPAHHKVELEELAREQDPVRAWLDEYTEPVGETEATVLWESYQSAARNSGIPLSLVGTRHAWGRRLSKLGYPARKQGVVYRPLSLRRSNWVMPGVPPVDNSVEKPVENSYSGGVSGTVDLSPVNPDNPKGPENLQDTSTQSVSLAVPVSEPLDLSPPEVDHQANQRSKGPTPSQSPISYPFGPFGPLEENSRNKEREDHIGVYREYGESNWNVRSKVQRSKTAPLDDLGDPVENSVQLPAWMSSTQGPTSIPISEVVDIIPSWTGRQVTLDVEHTGYPLGYELFRVKTIQIGVPDSVVVLDAYDPDQVGVAAAVLDVASEIVAHSATADIIPVADLAGRAPEDWWPKVTDTGILAALADPTVTGAHEVPGALQLEKLTARLVPGALSPDADRARQKLFSANKWLENVGTDTAPERNGWLQVPVTDPVMVRYAASDVLDTSQLVKRLPAPSPELMSRERATQAATARVTHRGLLLDADRVESFISTHEDAQGLSRARLEGLGINNPNSPKQVAAVLEDLGAVLPRTEKGAPSTAVDALEELSGSGGELGSAVDELLVFREHDKLLSTYLRPMGELCRRGDGRMRPTILTLGAYATGRMSARGLNIQNIPRSTSEEAAAGGGGGMRGMVVADPGHLFISADFSSVEVRIAAAVTQDENLIRMLFEGIDLHGEVVRLAWGWGEDHVGFKDARQKAKGTVFGKIYGAGLATVEAQLGEHGHMASEVVGALERIAPGLGAFDRQLRAAVSDRSLPSWVHPSGRECWFEPDRPHKSLNKIVQGYGRELLVDSLLRWEALHPGCTLVPIHDELLVQVPEDCAEAWSQDLVDCMTTEIGGVPIVAEATVPSRRWGTEELDT